MFIITVFFLYFYDVLRHLHSFPTRRSSDLVGGGRVELLGLSVLDVGAVTSQATTHPDDPPGAGTTVSGLERSEEHTSELQSRGHLVCRLLLEKKKEKHQKKMLNYVRDRHTCALTLLRSCHCSCLSSLFSSFISTTSSDIYTLSLHDALPIWSGAAGWSCSASPSSTSGRSPPRLRPTPTTRPVPGRP